jgi:tripartite tricarboxylate transporter family receptor
MQFLVALTSVKAAALPFPSWHGRVELIGPFAQRTDRKALRGHAAELGRPAGLDGGAPRTDRHMGTIRSKLRHPCVAVLILALAAPAAAQQLSGRTITIVVPFTPATGPDVMARLVGEGLRDRWKEAVIVENKPGATVNIGAQFVARAAPDGHTLLMTSNPFTSNVSLFARVPNDPIRSFAPIIDVGAGALALCVHPSVPANDVAEFIAFAQATPGSVVPDFAAAQSGLGDPVRVNRRPCGRTAAGSVARAATAGNAAASAIAMSAHSFGPFLA